MKAKATKRKIANPPHSHRKAGITRVRMITFHCGYTQDGGFNPTEMESGTDESEPHTV